MPQRKDGRYYRRVYCGTVDGKKLFRYCYGATQKEADKKAEDLKFKQRQGINVSSTETLAYWIDAFVCLKRSTCTDKQADLVASRLRYFSHWNGRDWDEEIGKHCLGSFRLSEVLPIHLQTALNALASRNPYTGSPTAKNTLKPVKQAINAAFENAIYNRATDFNPAARLILPKDAPQKERRALTVGERNILIKLKHRARIPALLMMLCGLRRGEVTALTWEDVDLKNREITVSKSYDFKESRLKHPKTAAGLRSVPVPEILLPELEEGKRSASSPLVVTSASGQRMTETAWKRLLESYLCDINAAVQSASKFSPKKLPQVFEPFGWHCLRHTYATILFEAGVDALAAKELLGHSDIKTTLNIYTHLQENKKTAELMKLDDYLKADGVSDGVS